MNVGVFIEPEGELLHAIRDWKERVELALPAQPLCSHPPHCTLVHVQLRRDCLLVDALLRAVAVSSGITLTVGRVHVFENDTGTDGGHSLVFRVDWNPQLAELQTNVARALSYCLVGRDSPPPFPLPRQRESYERYGFPFVGDHWIPHFSVASVKAPFQHPLIREFGQLEPAFTSKVRKISLWEINEDQHRKILSVHLRERE